MGLSLSSFDPTTLGGRKKLLSVGTLGTSDLINEASDWAGDKLRGLGGGGGDDPIRADMSVAEISPRDLQMSFGGVAGGQTAMSPEMQRLQTGMLSQAGGGYVPPGYLQGAARGLTSGGMQDIQDLRSRGAFDISGLAQEQFGLMQQMVGGARQQRRSGAEANLMARGMLSSSGGAAQLGELEQQFGQQDIAMAQQALGEARAAAGLDLQQRQLQQQRAMGMMGLGTGLGTGIEGMRLQQQQLGLQGLGFTTGLESGLLSQAYGIGAQEAGNRVALEVGNMEAAMAAQAAEAARQQQMGSGIGSLLGAGIGYTMGAPMLGAGIGGQLGGGLFG